MEDGVWAAKGDTCGWLEALVLPCASPAPQPAAAASSTSAHVAELAVWEHALSPHAAAQLARLRCASSIHAGRGAPHDPRMLSPPSGVWQVDSRGTYPCLLRSDASVGTLTAAAATHTRSSGQENLRSRSPLTTRGAAAAGASIAGGGSSAVAPASPLGISTLANAALPVASSRSSRSARKLLSQVRGAPAGVVAPAAASLSGGPTARRQLLGEDECRSDGTVIGLAIALTAVGTLAIALGVQVRVRAVRADGCLAVLAGAHTSRPVCACVRVCACVCRCVIVCMCACVASPLLFACAHAHAHMPHIVCDM